MDNFVREFKSVPVSVGLSTLLVVIYLAEIISSGGLSIDISTLYNFGGLFPASVYSGEWWRLVTAGFLHASLTHVALNVVVIYFIGRMLETTLGSLQLAALFLVGVVGGNLLALLLGNIFVISIGASSGAFALVGSMIYLGLREKQRGVWVQQMQTMLLFVGMNLVFSLFDSSIGIWAHVGGFLIGLTFTGALLQSNYAKGTFKTSTASTVAAWVVTGLLLAVLVARVIMRFNTVFY